MRSKCGSRRVVPKLWVATRKWVAKPCHVGRQLVPPKKFFTQQRVATIEIVVHWVAKKPEKFKWVSGQKSLGTTVIDSRVSRPMELVACNRGDERIDVNSRYASL
jgi:hypothetical protein